MLPPMAHSARVRRLSSAWTADVGIEAMFNQNWSAKAEYLYVDFGNRAIFNDNIGGVILPESLRLTANILRVGLNYRFGY